MISRKRRLSRRTRPDVRWYRDIWCKTVPPGQSRRILRWPVCGWHQQTLVNRKQTLLNFLSYTPITFSSVSSVSGQNRSSPTSAPSVTLHLMQTSPAAHAVACQQISICMGNVPKVSDRCLNKPTSRTYIHSYTALCLIYSIYTCIVHIHITNVPLQVMSNTLMWHRYTVCIPKDNG